VGIELLDGEAVTITSTTLKLIDKITPEEKAKVRAKLELDAGHPYARIVLSLILDAEKQPKAKPRRQRKVMSQDYQDKLWSISAFLEALAKKTVDNEDEDKLREYAAWLAMFTRSNS
jgi:hypothetical protein